MCVTYALLIVPTGLFINNIALSWGPGVVFGAAFLLLTTLVFYTFTACSDPGMVLEDEELKLSETESNSKFECGLCNILRPKRASHCFECGICVLELDHHCPVSYSYGFFVFVSSPMTLIDRCLCPCLAVSVSVSVSRSLFLTLHLYLCLGSCGDSGRANALAGRR